MADFRHPRLIALTVATLVILLLTGSYSSSRVYSFRQHLDEITPIFGSSDLIKPHALANQANELGRAAIFKANSAEFQNPSVLVLPQSIDERFRYLMVADGLHTQIDQPVWAYEKTGPPNLNFTKVFRIATCFLKPLDLRGGRSEFECQTAPVALDLKAPEGSPLHLCGAGWLMHLAIENDDGRMWLADDLAPLMIWHSSHPWSCRGMSQIDLRAVIPKLAQLYREAGIDAPIIYKEPHRLVKNDQQRFEKNWAHLPAKMPTYYTQLSPHHVHAQETAFGTNLTLVSVSKNKISQNCIVAFSEYQPNVDDEFHSSPDRNHLGTAFLRVKQCMRKNDARQCPTILVGIFNRKREDGLYGTRVLVLANEPPYSQLSLSQPIVFAGVASHDFVFTHGLVWRYPQLLDGEISGYLDDRVLISIGIADTSGAILEVEMSDLLASQMACPL